MGRFARQAHWLSQLFPPTTTPQVTDPGAVSDDVQLVELYSAGGQTRRPSSQWMATATATNPGQNANRSFLQPSVIAPGIFEVWRPFFVTWEIAGGPAANFDFDVILTDNQTGSRVVIQEAALILAGNATPTLWIQTNPVLLPSDGTRAIELGIRQISAQASGLETLTCRFYVLRNRTGETHFL